MLNLNPNIHAYYKAISNGHNTVEFKYDKKNSLYVPLFSSSIEQSFAIHLLLEEGLTNSAFALARPMVEGYLRAMWVKNYLDESKVKEGCAQLHFPKNLDILMSDIAKVLGENDLFHKFKLTIEPILPNMHDFTHGGVQSVARQYSSDGLLSNTRSRQEREQLLHLAVLTSYLCFENLAPLMKNSDSIAAVSKKAKELMNLYHSVKPLSEI